jgi:hypothetical protein
MRTICAAVTLVLLATAAPAQQLDAFDACAQEKDPTARLACFDRADAARHATPRAPTVAPAAAPAARPAPAVGDRELGLDAREAHKQRAERGEADPPAPTGFVATVVRVIARTPVISAFELSNGQIWEESEAVKFSAEPQQTVTIRHGMLGSFFLKNAEGVSVRVHRLK